MKRILSFIIPIRLKRITSGINGTLEVVFCNGRKLLDSKTSNYSFGSLQRVLLRGLNEIKFDSRFRNILLLGLGGGSVIESIRKHFHSNAFIEAVEIDPVMISVAEHEFHLKTYQNIHVVQSDAAEYMEGCSSIYDLIVIDIFIGDTVPGQFTKVGFMEQVSRNLSPKGAVIFNTMRATMPAESYHEITKTLSAKGLNVRILDKVEGTNTLVIAER